MLIKCPECGKQISDKAVACPNCGCPSSRFFPSSDASVRPRIPTRRSQQPCHSERSEESVPVVPALPSVTPRATKRGLAALVIVLALLLAASVAIVCSSLGGSPAATPALIAATPAAVYATHTDVEAFVIAEAIVENALKAPGTAEFCSFTDAEITSLGKGEYMVTGWVDAENGYGATLRSEFLVTYTATEKGYKNGSVIFE